MSEKRKSLRVLGLDVGSRNFGVAIVSRTKGEDALLFSKSLYLAESSIGDRLIFLEEKLLSYVEDYLVNHIIFEAPVIKGKNGKDILYTCAVVHMVAAKCNTPVTFVAPSSVKKIITGSGSSGKKEVELAVRDHLKELNITNYKFDADHASDATAIALYYLLKK